MTTEYSIQKMVSDGTLSTIALGIQYLQRNDIYMRVAGEEIPQSGAPNGYTWSFVDNTTIKILPVVPNGVEVVVYRRTDADSMYNVYSQNAQFDEATIDENNTQLLFLSQEYLEQGSGIEAVEYLRSEGNVHYYRLQLYGGRYTDEFTIITQLPPGYERGAGDFVTGFTVMPGMRNVAWLNPAPSGDNNLYSWSGEVPPSGKVVPPNSTPETTGGFVNAWVPRADETLRGELAAHGGAGSVGFDHSIAYAPMSVGYKLKNTVSITDAPFNAPGDGVNEDTSAILSALTHVKNLLTGGVVVFPPGRTYVVAGGAIKVKSSNTFIMAMGAKIKMKDSPTVNQGAMIQLGDYGDTSVRGTLKNIGIIGGEWDGNKANQKNGSTLTGNGDGDNSGIRMEDVDGIYLSRCVVKDCDGYGISTVGSFLPNRKNLRWEYCSVAGCHYDGFDIKAGLDGYVLFNCVAEYNGIGGNILNRGGMGIDMRGNNGEAIGCISRGNRSGNFRIRENAGLNIGLTSCRSYDAPAGTYGYMIIGANTATYTLTDCTSFGDNIGLKHQRSNLVLVGGSIRNAITNGVLQQGNPQEIGKTTTAIPLAVGTVIVRILNVSPSSAVNCGPYNNIIITDGTNSVTGLVTDVNGATGELTLNVASFTGGAPVAVGATATILDIGSLSVNGTKVMYNGQDGYSLDAPEYKTNIIGGGTDFNGRYGINNTKCALTVIGGSVKNNGQTSAAKRGIIHNGVAKRVVLRDVYLGDDQAIPTQGSGIQFSGTDTGSGLISGCDFTGNTSTPIQNSPPAGWRVRDCLGLETEASLLSAGFAVDTTGVKSFTVIHGINKTPTLAQITTALIRDTNVTDYECDTPKISGVNSTFVSCTVNVRVASATAGATAKLAITIDSSGY